MGGTGAGWAPEHGVCMCDGIACLVAGGGGGGRGADSAQPQLHLPGVMTNVMIAFSFFSIRYGALNHH